MTNLRISFCSPWSFSFSSSFLDGEVEEEDGLSFFLWYTLPVALIQLRSDVDFPFDVAIAPVSQSMATPSRALSLGFGGGV